jgi:hypothetical protein
LEVEKLDVETEIKKLQKEYYKDHKISQNEYDLGFKILHERLAEIENEHTTLEVIKNKNKRLIKNLKKKSKGKKWKGKYVELKLNDLRDKDEKRD